MSVAVQVKRRINGAPGSPPAAGFKEGELSLNFPGAAGGVATPEFYAHDGSAWRRVNPTATSASVQLPGGTPGSQVGIGAAWNTYTPKPTDPIIVATFAGTAYIKTGPGTNDNDWTALGAAMSFASQAEVNAGTETTRALNSALLRGTTLATPSGTPANDADRIVRLGTTGKIDPGFLSITGVQFLGAIAPAGPAPANPKAGDLYFVSAHGVADASFGPPVAGTMLEAQDMLIHDGTKWNAVQGDTDLSAYLPLVGGTMAATAAVIFAPAPNPMVRLDGGAGGNSRLDNFVIDCGSF